MHAASITVSKSNHARAVVNSLIVSISAMIMADKVMTVVRDKLGQPFGKLDDDDMAAVNRLLALFLGFA